MIVDFHTHIFPPEICARRAEFASRDPAFGLLYGDPKARMVDVEQHLQAMEREGVDQAVVCGFPWADPGLCQMANDYLLDAQRRYPERLCAFYTPCISGGDPEARTAADALNRGMRGIGEVASYVGSEDRQQAGWARLDPLAEVALESKVPFLLHANESVGHTYPGKVNMRLREVWDFACRFPRLTLVLAHWGGGLFFYELMPSVRSGLAEVYYDTAASLFLYDSRIWRIAIEILGAERIVFGSDHPLIPPSRYFREMEEVGLTAEERARIMGANALKLLGPG